ncbi:PAS domain-containing protein [Bradyrhizobium sp. UFLA05-109]
MVAAYPAKDYARQSIADALQDIIQGGPSETAARIAISALRNASYTVAQLLEECASAKDAVLRQADCSDHIIKVWQLIDSVAAAALRETACIHETVLKTCARGYVELGPTGTVIYANDALLEFCPDLIGRRLADVFLEADQVNEALATARRTGPFRFTLRCLAKQIPVNVEFGPIRAGPVSHYALIGDIRAYVAAQITGFQSAPFGIARVDAGGAVQFVNQSGSEQLGEPASHLVGRRVAELVAERECGCLETFIDPIHRSPDGPVATFHILHPKRGEVPIEVSAVPEFAPQHRQIGTLVFFRSLELDRARADIYEACERYRDSKTLISRLFDILKRVIPFDLAIFGIYSDSMKYYRRLQTSPPQKGPDETRWSEIPPEFAQWILYEQPWASDLESYFDKFTTGAEVRQRPIVKRMIADGIKSFICLPVRQDNQVTTVLTLLSRERGRYGAKDYDNLRSLPVEQALRMAGEWHRQRLAQLVRETVPCFAEAKSHRELAHIATRQLAMMFDWEHVSLFKANHLKQQFELLEHSETPCSGFALPTDYRQSFTEGLMGQALRDETHRSIDDTYELTLPYPYVRLHERSRSSLCIPIRLEGTISWMLNIEDTATHAFHGTDLQGLLAIVAELSRTLDRLFQAHLTENILNLTDQGAVVIDAMGRIRDLNKAAEVLLGAPKQTLQGRPFVEFATPRSEDVLAERSLTTERHLVLRDVNAACRPVIASLRVPSDDYDHKIWLLTDTAQQDWNIERRYLREAVHDVAQQTRVPLMIAGRLVSRLAHLLADDEVHPRIEEIISKALKQLGKADITYERLVGGLVGKRSLDEPRTPLNLAHMLDEVLSELPDDDRLQVRSDVSGTPIVLAEQKAVEFVLKSILFYLLRKKPVERSVEVSVAAEPKGVRLHLSIAARKAPTTSSPLDVVSRFEEEARATAALAPDSLRSAIESQGGQVRIPDPSAATMTFEVWLPDPTVRCSGGSHA